MKKYKKLTLPTEQQIESTKINLQVKSNPNVCMVGTPLQKNSAVLKKQTVKDAPNVLRTYHYEKMLPPLNPFSSDLPLIGAFKGGIVHCNIPL